MPCNITVLPSGQIIPGSKGEDLLTCLRRAGFAPKAPCGGNGTCGKCKVLIDGTEVLACKTIIETDLIVTLSDCSFHQILVEGNMPLPGGNRNGALLAFDIGTTTVAGFLLDGPSGKLLAQAGVPNPQAAFGADVVTRIRHALDGHMAELTDAIRRCITSLAGTLCQTAGIAPETIAIVIGPEGGFSDKEAELMDENGAVRVTLGKTILRTETAGMAALAMTMYELEL
jgi:uncharacterized 2Fe-2S/4Fe-4S cluster protein (DUF4445 family)